MCGIAGYSLDQNTDIDTSVLTKLLLAGLAERGEDASGYAFRHDGLWLTVNTPKELRRADEHVTAHPEWLA